MKVPAVVGVPVIVIVLFAQVAVTPSGKPVGVPIPIKPKVEDTVPVDMEWLIVVNGVFMHKVGVEGDELTIKLAAETVMVPVALTFPLPPVRGML